MSDPNRLLETEKEILFGPTSYEMQPDKYQQAIFFIAPWVERPGPLPVYDDAPYHLIRAATLRGGLAYQHLMEIARFKGMPLATVNLGIKAAAQLIDIEGTGLTREVLMKGMRSSLISADKSYASIVELQRFFHNPKEYYEPTQILTTEQGDAGNRIRKYYFLHLTRLHNVLAMYSAAHLEQYTDRSLGERTTVAQQHETEHIDIVDPESIKY